MRPEQAQLHERCVMIMMMMMYVIISRRKGKGKAVSLQAWTGPEGSKEVKVPRFRDNGTGWW